MRKRMLTVLLAVVMLFGLLPVTAFAVEGNDQQTTASVSSTADGDTRYTYQSVFNLNNTRYDGRIWTDKTVMSEDMKFTGNLHYPDQAGTGQATIELGTDEDFLVSYSALASTTSVIEQSKSPLDLVLVLDLSPMSNNVEGKCRALLNAVAEAVESLIGMNPENRVSVVAYSSQAEVLLPLDKYSHVSFSYSGQAMSGATVTCNYRTAEGGTSETLTFPVANGNTSGINKYTQMGIYTGMNILLNAKDKEVEIGDDRVTRQPVMILLSEGDPKIASTNINNPTPSGVPVTGLTGFDSNNIWDGEDNGVEIRRNVGLSNANPQSSQWDERHAQTFATLLTAAYMKQEVTEAYFGSGLFGDEEETLMYTVGIRTASANSPELAEIMLDPSTYLNEETSNELSDDFIRYIEDYIKEGTVSMPDAGIDDHETVFNMDDSEFKLNDIDELKYNDLFFNVIGDGGDLDFGDIFGDILTDITSSVGHGSTQVDENDPEGYQSGYITYTDPIGDYMTVKAVKAMIIDDVIYENPTVSKEGNTTTYTFTGMANNPVYGAGQISRIEIKVTRADDGSETVFVNIPAAQIPLRLTTVLKDENDNVIRFAHNNTFPFRLVYSVGFQEGIIDENGYLNIGEDGVSAEYIKQHTGADGQVYFYEGQYSAQTQPSLTGEDKTVGDAYVTYTPAHPGNPFYYVGEDTPLYTDPDCKVPATGEFKDNDTYYFKIFYYQATPEGSTYPAIWTEAVVARRGADFLDADGNQSVKNDKDGNQWYIPAGEPRLGNLADFMREKLGADGASTNQTDTAQSYLYLSFDQNLTDTNGHPTFKVYHGNNGRKGVSLPPGTLSVTNNVVGAEHVPEGEMPDFNFMLTLTNGSATTVDANGQTETVNEGEMYSFTLAAGETKVFQVTDGTTWSVDNVTQLPLPDPSSPKGVWFINVTADALISNNNVMGVMSAEGQSSVIYTHSYNLADTRSTLAIHKLVENDGAAPLESFEFTLTDEEGNLARDADGNEIQPFSLADRNMRTLEIQPGTYTLTERILNPTGWTAEHEVIGATEESSSSNSTTFTVGNNVLSIVAFTNSYTTPGSLTISKIVEGGEADKNKEYEFEVTIDGTKETIRLKDGEVKTYLNLAAGTNYSVKEITQNSAGWYTTVNGEEGTEVSGIIESAKVSTANFVNAAPGTLTVEKTVNGGAADQSFDFTLTYDDKTESFTLKNGEKKEFVLPAGTEYKVTEADPGEGWTTTMNGVNSRESIGVIAAGETDTAQFTNTAPGMLTVTKKVVGGSEGQEFDFTLIYGTETKTFTLTDGASETFSLPDGTEYTVTEEDLGSRWTTTVNGTEGQESTGIIETDKTASANFVNTYKKPGGTAQYTLRYESNGGTVYDDERYNRNTIVTLDKTPVREGYTFTGWYADADLTEKINEIQMTSDKTVYAGWKITGVPEWLNGDDHFAYVIGYPDGNVEPKGNITRAEVATIFFRLLKEDVRSSNLSTESGFADVLSENWFNTEISTMAALGILQGRAADTFEPNAPITRAEFAAICARFDTARTNGASNFTDISGHWAKAEIERAVTLGWITGYEDDTFRPDNYITRAEAMTMINRVLQRLPENAEDLLAGMNIWPDNQPGDWYYLAVQEATNSHHYDRKADDVHEHWTELRDDPDWTQY